jgi:hypothetical protein
METVFFKPTGRYDQQVVGESHHQEHLAYLASMSDDGFIESIDLFLEGYNKYDSNAVAVSIEAEDVGYLPKPDALRYRQKLKTLGHPDAIGVCAGKLTGGHDLPEGGQAHYGIVLDLDIDNLIINDVASAKTNEAWQKKTNPPPASKPSNSISKFIVSAFSKQHWWKTALILFALVISPACLCAFSAMLQGIYDGITK